MLSGLPDEVLCHILSFLSTKRSLCTSVLAKRWRFLWAHVPNLQFYQYNFRVDSETQPLDIMSRVLMLHEAKVVNTFSFRLSHLNGCGYQLLTLIIHLVKRNVRNLYLEFDCENEDVACTVPRLLLTCKTLVDLKLVNCGVIFSIGEPFLPSLKKLNLSCVEYEDEKSLPRLLSGCPMLEELIVHDCFMGLEKSLGCVIVSSPTIKTLIVVFSWSYEWYPEERLRIDVPNLIYLKVDCCDLECVKSLSKTMTSLIEVDITVYGGMHTCHIDCTIHSRSIEFLSCLSHVKCFKITCEFQFILVAIVGTASLPKFVHLTKLNLDLVVDFNDLVEFLEAADNLEVLIIHLSGTLTYKEPKRVPPCMSSRLRTVRMYQFSACEDAYDTVGYVLRNARALEKMEIDPARHISCDKVKLIDALRRILLFERGSTSCQLAFNTD